MRSVKITLAAGLTLLAVGIVAALARSPMSLARVNRTVDSPQQPIAQSSGRTRYCQAHEVLPARTSLVRVSLQASIGPRAQLSVSSNGLVIAAGEQGRGWNGGVVGVPLRPMSRSYSDVTVCVSFRAQNELLTLHGQPVAGMARSYDEQGPLQGSMRLEYLRAGERSWASLIPTIVRHMGLGRALEGTAPVLVALALLAAVVALASRLLVEELL